MDKELQNTIQEARFEVLFDPVADGNCFYRAAAHQLGLGWKMVKNLVFDYLERNQFDVSISEFKTTVTLLQTNEEQKALIIQLQFVPFCTNM